jgi:hypothetical protein
MRQQAAESLPVPFEGDAALTKGQLTRSFEQQRFEQEAAKNPTLGEPLRNRSANQNDAIKKNLDAFIDATGAQAPNLREVGITVDKALTEKAVRDKTAIRVAYKEAEKAGELQAPVSSAQITDLLNNSVSAEATAPVLKAARAELIRLGGAVEENATLIPKSTSLGDMEMLRKFVNKVAGADPTNIKFSADIKRAIDASTEGAGGELYKRARTLRARFADQYENHAVISKLLSMKRGTSDRQVAFEDVFSHSILNGSLDDVRTLRKTLQTSGTQGQQAWRELQGQGIAYLRDQATKNVARDTRGNPIVSAAGLDKAVRSIGDKLDFIYGKKGAEQVRLLNDVAKDVLVAVPGSVNTSNTASVILAAMDMAISGSAGLPLPVLSAMKLAVRSIKDRKLKARIADALGAKK